MAAGGSVAIVRVAPDESRTTVEFGEHPRERGRFFGVGRVDLCRWPALAAELHRRVPWSLEHLYGRKVGSLAPLPSTRRAREGQKSRNSTSPTRFRCCLSGMASGNGGIGSRFAALQRKRGPGNPPDSVRKRFCGLAQSAVSWSSVAPAMSGTVGGLSFVTTGDLLTAGGNTLSLNNMTVLQATSGTISGFVGGTGNVRLDGGGLA